MSILKSWKRCIVVARNTKRRK